ncbi:P-loop containing nucleoside triphosphate hydrolase protein [Podospora aff. communis PSN243]|uniref:P-loop containing nucleoside triphosphate hydrolase protein n=1 Tax=Podospora aff. communis PSN243 TaxID=3040156 RepID=A0AAV9GUN5_9PEZI|nr:P-loop containing nucleoside triphosphate hydrolase protein [Podospora aff. communis PSN243]
MTHHDSLLALFGTGAAVIGLFSLPAVSATATRFAKPETKADIYEDEDGQASPESMKAFSAKVPKGLILLFAATGLSVSITLLLLTIHDPAITLKSLVLIAAAWGALLFQAVAIASSRNSVQAYDLGIHTFFSSLVLGGIVLTQGTKHSKSLLEGDPVLATLWAIELTLTVCLAIAGLSLPRRPDVFKDGHMIDRMHTVSAFTRFNFNWPSGVLTLASKKKNLDLADLNRMDHHTRAADVSADWKCRNYKHRLWISVILAHKGAFAIQWALTLCSSVLNFAPQWVILQLLRILETRSPGSRSGIEVWVWVIWLFVAIIAQAWVESYIFWLSWAELTIPVRAQLSALIFEKAMRRKDVKGSEKSKKKPDSDGPAQEATETTKPKTEDDDETEVKKSKQSTVNLIGVDAKRVGDFTAYQTLFPGSVFKLAVSLTFLVSLLGWKALLAGFSAMLAIMPINIHFSKLYSAAQDRLMKIRDEKMEVVTEALQGMRQIKFSALEPEWEKKIGSVRERELTAVWDVYRRDTMLIACWVTSPILLSAISLAVYAWLNGTLTPSVAFVSLGVFKALEVTLSVVPELTTDLLDCWVSINRIEGYLNSPEVEPVSKDSDDVSFGNVSIAWPADEGVEEEDKFVLRNINVTFPEGELSVISGKTGTGKSLMLAAILGEVDVLAGTLYVPRSPPLSDRHDSKANKDNWIISKAIAYVAQIPWIENASIRDNITFGLPYDLERYKKTVEVCALTKDLEMLTDGENTEIGANGINLSGGQKWRVTLARAIYSRAGILVLDDIFSAVDAHVGRHIFDKCLNGELCSGRTRILVTHHVALCEPKTKYLVELGEGGVLSAGLLSELREEGTLERIKSKEQSSADIESYETVTAVNSDTDGESTEASANGEPLKKVPSKSTARKFIEEESREQGAVHKRVYLTYIRDSGGWLFWAFAIFLFTVVQGFSFARSWWLKIWTGSSQNQPLHAQAFNASREHGLAFTTSVHQTSIHTVASPSIHIDNSLLFYLGIYVLLAVISSVVGTLKYLYIYVGSIKASRRLFAKLNFTILRMPIRWLDTVPVGRILNRYTADFNTIDSQLANSLSFGAGSFLGLIAVNVAGLFVTPYTVLLSVVLLAISLYYALAYLDGARPVKRLESTAKSPVFEQFGSALAGVATIRGFNKAEVYIQRMYQKLDNYSVMIWHLWLFNRWLGWRMAVVGSFFAIVISVLILITPNIDSSLAGFALAFALEFSGAVMWTVRLYANIELNMNAAERIIEYTELPTEPLDGKKPPAAWPTQGRIEVEDLVVGYATDLPPVLKGLTFSVESNERIGVVGRTGAGKSSLTLALFRFLEARSGSIHIDGQDISKINLHDLRSRLAIIPQDPVLFSGTVRSNLDPFDNHTDAELREALDRVHLLTDSASTSGAATPTGGSSSSATFAPKNTNIFNNLDSSISEGGLNLSQGQRQLLCLARAIVSRPRVMVLDEATSAVDMHTDGLIQRSIREEFTDSTLIVIAHRLSTIADFDRILVLSDGQVAEYGPPRDLWKKEGGIFRGMCEESGEREKLRGVVFGEQEN